VAKDSLIRIKKAAGDRITVKFDAQEVKHLAQLELDITNQGVDPLKDFEFAVAFRDGTEILHIDGHGIPDNDDFTISVQRLAPHRMKFHVPYLNPFGKHKHRIRLGFMCDGDIDKVSVTGHGPGWSLKQKAAPNRSRNLKRASVAIAISMFTLGVATACFSVVVWHDSIWATTVYPAYRQNREALDRVHGQMHEGRKDLDSTHDLLASRLNELDAKMKTHKQKYKNASIVGVMFLVMAGITTIYALILSRKAAYEYRPIGDPNRKITKRRPRKPKQSPSPSKEKEAEPNAPPPA
jgi:hypothetical protein